MPAPGEAGLAGELWPGRCGLSLPLPACSVAWCPPGTLCQPHRLLHGLPRWLPGCGVGAGLVARAEDPPWTPGPRCEHFLPSPQAGWAPSADFSGKLCEPLSLAGSLGAPWTCPPRPGTSFQGALAEVGARQPSHQPHPPPLRASVGRGAEPRQEPQCAEACTALHSGLSRRTVPCASPGPAGRRGARESGHGRGPRRGRREGPGLRPALGPAVPCRRPRSPVELGRLGDRVGTTALQGTSPGEAPGHWTSLTSKMSCALTVPAAGA